MITRRRWLCALLAALLIAAYPPPVMGQGALDSGVLDIGSRFGIIDAHTDPDAAADLGVGWERITFDWAAIQPDGPGDFRTDAVDPVWLENAADAGREVVGLIVHTPAWASESGDPGAVPVGLEKSVRRSDNVWAAFVRQLAAHYAPLGVHRWIIYDTPNVRVGEGTVQFAGSESDYARLLAVAHDAITAADPDAVIHLAAPDWWADVAAGREPFLARLLRVLQADPDAATSGTYFDVVTVRAVNHTRLVWDVLSQTRAILEAARLFGKPIWLETGASPTRDPNGGTPDPVLGISPSMQADFIVQAAALGLAAGAQRIGVIQLADDPAGDQPWGLVRADGSRRPAFDAYRAAIRLFDTTQTAARFASESAVLVTLDQDRRTIYVMWASDVLPVEFAITTAQNDGVAGLFDVLGRFDTIQSEPFDWPAAFRVDLSAAGLDRNGFLTVAGSPQLLVLDTVGDFFRVVYVQANGEWSRLR
ncbi:MAG: hypothetical protein JW910_17935 [Anaerolineae bacterium]|nr:hypothetical protein [Anaerolineae bacterium]